MPAADHHIATLNEGPLHTALKTWYARPGDRTEVPIDGRQIDIVRGELLIEIQTTSLSALRDKLVQLVADHPVRLVHPVPAEKWIVRIDEGHCVIGRRRSPKRGAVHDAFRAFVSLAHLLPHPNLSYEVVLTCEEEVRKHEPGRAWRRRGWVTVERRLLDVVGNHVFDDPTDLLEVLPPELPDPFTTADLADQLRITRNLAQKVAYCLRRAGTIAIVGTNGNARTYRVVPSDPTSRTVGS